MDCDEADLFNVHGMPPAAPPDYWKHKPALVLTPDQAQDPIFAILAKAAWKNNRGYLINWLWEIYRGSLHEKQRDEYADLEREALKDL